MTKEDIIRMAREANRYAASQTDDSFDFPLIRDERFASLIAAAEREECAQLCEQWNASHPEALAAAIRARKEKQ